MKKILGLDLGTTSIGWALVNEAESETERSEIIKIGSRVIPLTTDESTDFSKGKSITINADRTLKRGARRNLQRFKQRRNELTSILIENKIINTETVLTEEGKNSTHVIWEARAKSATEKIELSDFARVLLAINKKRGYKSNRKAKDEGDGQAIDGMEVAIKLYEEGLTPGQFVYSLLKDEKRHIPDFYGSDLQNEFDRIWEYQNQYYPAILTGELKEKLKDKNKSQTWAICKEPFDIVGVKRTTKGKDQKLENYQWRTQGMSQQLDLEQLAIVLQEINNQKNQSSGLLGAISDRSKKLYLNKETVGQYLNNQLRSNPHTRLKNQVFYRQDYLDEFEKIWETQAAFHSELTPELKEEIRDVVIFYQRRLKSQKGMISICELEGQLKEIEVGGKPKMKIIGPRVIPKSSPLFQEYKIWQILNNLKFTEVKTGKAFLIQELDKEQEVRSVLFDELNISGKLSSKELLKKAFNKPTEWGIKNFESIEGNNTNQILFKAYQRIAELSGHEVDFSKMTATEILTLLSELFDTLGIDKELLYFDAELDSDTYQKQPSLQLWHLLYSYEGDNSKTGNDKLLQHLKEKFGFEKEYAQVLVNVSFKDDYGSLSTKAIRKILPFMKAGHEYSEAASFAGYNHSHAVTKEENLERKLKGYLEVLSKNSLRNPVVEKILNQMVHVVNAIIREYGELDEIRVELARDLKKSNKERAEKTTGMAGATKYHEQIRAKLREIPPFNNGVRITRNDIIKYKLYEELAENGYKTLYTNTYIPLEKLYSKDFDIEHVIPKAVLFDDSFSNKILASRRVNLDKGDATAFDFMSNKYGEDSDNFKAYLDRVEKLYKEKKIGKAKYNKLRMKIADVPDGFIERDIRNTQYIAKKAQQMLLEVTRHVVATSGSITDKLREDWQLIDVMRDLNWDKYSRLGLTYYEDSKDGRKIPMIKDWTKRNDHRHHAMDAITIAFTKHSHIQYYNYLNARKDENHKKHGNIIAIEKKETFVNDKNKRLVKPPIPIEQFRAEAKKHLKNTLISFKAKSKVVTRNKNKIKGGKPQLTLTPRGQLHKETVYGTSSHYVTKYEKIGTKFDKGKISAVAKKSQREAMLKRLEEFEGNPKKAFGGKNALAKNPVYLDEHQSEKLPEKVKLVFLENRFTIRKDISPDLKLDKVVDVAIRNILQERLAEFGGDSKKAFSNLEEKPIWLDEEKGIQIKRVTITGVSNAEPLHYKKDHHGNEISDEQGNPIPVDFVSTGNNHHVAIYRDESGNLQEEVVSFTEAVARINSDTPVVWTNHPDHPEWDFLFTMKQNEMFVFPNKETGFDPSETDLEDEGNYLIISPNLFRVQKIASKDYFFRHHLETTVENIIATKSITWKREGLSGVTGIIKVRINHLGQIVKVGEY